MADIISEEKVCVIMDAFNSLADRQGTVETKMLGVLMKRLGENPSQEEVQEMINEVDKEGVGIIRWGIIENSDGKWIDWITISIGFLLFWQWWHQNWILWLQKIKFEKHFECLMWWVSGCLCCDFNKLSFVIINARMVMDTSPDLSWNMSWWIWGRR